jgi:hypothetical protein
VSPAWAARRLADVPTVASAEPGPAWYPLQHAFGFTAFGANAFVAQAAGEVLVEEHDERSSGHEELYLVVAGRARFTLDGEVVEERAVTVVAVRDPAVTRSAVALEHGTTLIALGGPPRDDFRSTWRDAHFEGVPRLL